MTHLDDGTLVAFVDGELDAAAMRRVAEAIEHDPDAAEKVRLLRLSATLVRAAFREPRHLQVSSELTQMMKERPQMTPMPARRVERRFAIAFAASLAAAVAVGLVGSFVKRFDQPPGGADYSERLLDEIADYHVLYAREDEHLVEVPAERREHIEAWLGDRLEREIRVPDLSAHGLDFRGARLLVVDGRAVGQLIYTKPDRPHRPLALCIAIDGAGDEAVRTEAREGVTLATWRRQGYVYILAGWLDKATFGRLVAELVPALERV